MKYYLGIDGGGTKTTFTVINEYKEIVYTKTCGPSSIDTVTLQETENVIIEGTKDIPYKIKGTFAGIGGVASKQDIYIVCQMLKKISCLENKDNVSADNDVINALYGGIAGTDGIIVICGTGSVAFGKYQDKFYRAGGYGFMEGDAGSSYDLGHQAICHLSRVLDKRIKENEFAKDLMKETNCYDPISFTTYINKANRTKIASLAKIVTKHALNDKTYNEYAYDIINQGTDEIALMIKTVYLELKFKGRVKFSIIGSLGNAESLYKILLLRKIKDISSDIEFINKIYEADYGACLKAFELFNN